MFNVFLIFLAGILFIGAIYFLKPRMQKEKMWFTVLNWVLFVSWYFITWTGISFIIINASVGHVKATSTGIFLFLGLSVILAVILARITGFIGKSKTQIKAA